MTGVAALHASAVALEGRALLILGPSGAGKSALALEMIALGAGLIADDLVRIEQRGAEAFACPARTGADLIEARGLGLLRAPLRPAAPVRLVIDLGRDASARLPEPMVWRFGAAAAPLVFRPAKLQPAAIRLALLTGGPIDPALASVPDADQSLASGARVGASGANGVC